MYFDTTGDTSSTWPSSTRSSCAEDFDAFRITPEFSKGIYAMEAALEAAETKRPFVKVQTTGPVSFGLTHRGREQAGHLLQPRIHRRRGQGAGDEMPLADSPVPASSPRAVICFIDEPILSAFGSSTYVSVTREDVVAKLGEVMDAVHAEGALAGVHCCGNTEWSILMDAGVDIVNFDAFDYGETIALYPEAVKRPSGGGQGSGLGHRSDQQRQDSGGNGASLTAKFSALVENLAKATGLDRQLIVRQALITPSCGTGSLPVADAELVFKTLHELSTTLRQKIGAPVLAGAGA